jgi:hypothetical protein
MGKQEGQNPEVEKGKHGIMSIDGYFVVRQEKS